MAKLDQTALYRGFVTEKSYGYYAEFNPEGLLKHLSLYINGKKVGSWLDLNHDDHSGVGNDGEPNGFYTTYENGCADRRDAWSDNDPPKMISFEDWARSWIDTVYNNTPVVCGFCGMSHHPKHAANRAYFEGFRSLFFICDHCAQAASSSDFNGMFQTSKIDDTQAASCFYCDRTQQEFVIKGPRQAICSDCLGEFAKGVRAAIKWI